MKYFIFILSITFLFSGCKEDPEVIKQKKIDKAVKEFRIQLQPEINKIAGLFENLKKYSDYLKSEEVQQYKKDVEKASQPYLEEFQKLVPMRLKYQKPIKTQNFQDLEKVILNLKRIDNIESLYEETLKSKNFLKFNDIVKDHLKVVDQILEYLDSESDWYHENPEDSIVGLGELRQVAKSIKYSAMLEAFKGDFKSSKEYLSLLHNYAIKLEAAKGPLILKLVAYAIHHINFSALTELLEDNILDLNQIKELEDLYSTFAYPEKSDLSYMVSVDLQMFVQFSAASKVGGNDYILLQLYPLIWFDDNPDETLEWMKKEMNANKSLSQEKYLKLAIHFFEALSDDFKNWKVPGEMNSSKALEEMITKGEKTLESEFRRVFFKHYPRIVKKTKCCMDKI
ncbi:MAG: hypothetical protein NE328_18305 [Lentisphaeraceae bacterium]|nr:hypothetical protein [Lentisphaeraceae bacterium]